MNIQVAPPPRLAQMQSFGTGNTIGKYLLKQFIGRGNFGEVWLATDCALGCDYAIKILKPGQLNVAQRLREAYIGHSLDHKNVVRVHNADVVGELVVLAMDYMPAGSVVNQTNADNFLPLPDCIRVGQDMLRGLDYFHSRNLFHNDVKPENLLIGSSGQAMLNDYGIVGYSPDGSEVAPPDVYMLHAAPEVLNRSRITAQTDIYQAGPTLFRLAGGLSSLQAKRERLGEDAFKAVVTGGKFLEAADFPPWVQSKLKRIILKAVSADLTKRYATALDMRRELEKLNYTGFWTVGDCGSLIGQDSKNQFWLDKTGVAGSRIDLTAFRRNLKSGRETRVTAHCHSGLTPAEATKKEVAFFKAVMEGL